MGAADAEYLMEWRPSSPTATTSKRTRWLSASAALCGEPHHLGHQLRLPARGARRDRAGEGADPVGPCGRGPRAPVAVHLDQGRARAGADRVGAGARRGDGDGVRRGRGGGLRGRRAMDEPSSRPAFLGAAVAGAIVGGAVVLLLAAQSMPLTADVAVGALAVLAGLGGGLALRERARRRHAHRLLDLQSEEIIHSTRSWSENSATSRTRSSSSRC